MFSFASLFFRGTYIRWKVNIFTGFVSFSTHLHVFWIVTSLWWLVIRHELFAFANKKTWGSVCSLVSRTVSLVLSLVWKNFKETFLPGRILRGWEAMSAEFVSSKMSKIFRNYLLYSFISRGLATCPVKVGTHLTTLCLRRSSSAICGNNWRKNCTQSSLCFAFFASRDQHKTDWKNVQWVNCNGHRCKRKQWTIVNEVFYLENLTQCVQKWS